MSAHMNTNRFLTHDSQLSTTQQSEESGGTKGGEVVVLNHPPGLHVVTDDVNMYIECGIFG